MPKLSATVFYGNSIVTKSDSSFSKLNNASMKRLHKLRASPTRPKTCERQKQSASKNDILSNRPRRYPTKSTTDKVLSSSMNDVRVRLTDINYETNSKKAKLENMCTPLCYDDNEPSDYEKQIQNNITDRMKFFEKLNILDAKKSFEDSVKLTISKPKSKKK